MRYREAQELRRIAFTHGLKTPVLRQSPGQWALTVCGPESAEITTADYLMAHKTIMATARALQENRLEKMREEPADAEETD